MCIRDRLGGLLRVGSSTVTWALEHIVDIGDSMRAKGYGLKGRSSFFPFRFTWREDVYKRQEQKKAQIGEIEKKIEQINTEILDSLYPFENIGYGDKGTIDSILSQINQLSEYDRNQVDVYKRQTGEFLWEGGRVEGSQVRISAVMTDLCLTCLLYTSCNRNEEKTSKLKSSVSLYYYS